MGCCRCAGEETEGTNVLSIEFKLNLLRPCVGSHLRCRADVLRAGRTISVVESRVWAVQADGEEKLTSVMTATMALTRVGADKAAATASRQDGTS